jgi:hypothetical protein
MEAILKEGGWKIEQLYTPERMNKEFLAAGEGAVMRGAHNVLATRI